MDLVVGLYGFTDGFFVKKDAMMYKANMGGYLKDNKNNLMFIFSGPLQVNSVLLAEFLQRLIF